jgi:hypothetical protein
MTKITIEVCQCDFCGNREFTLPTCIICGRHICPQHRNSIDFGVFSKYERTDKTKSLFRESQYACPECIKKRKELYVELANQLIAESEKEEELPPEEVIPK